MQEQGDDKDKETLEGKSYSEQYAEIARTLPILSDGILWYGKYNERLSDIAEQLKAGKEVESVRVRDFLRWFKAERRGNWVVINIRKVLERFGLVTKPDFDSTYIDGPITFELLRTELSEIADTQTSEGMAYDNMLAEKHSDPTYRIGKLKEANMLHNQISPHATIKEAITIMMVNGCSHLPVMTSDRDVKGVISWYSIGQRLANGIKCEFVRDCMDRHVEVQSDTSLFESIDTIVANHYVLVRDDRKVVTGMVTTADLSMQFRQLAEPFLLIGEIENHLRMLIDNKFGQQDLAAVKDPDDTDRTIDSSNDLTFGEYVRLLENEERWNILELRIDRKLFIQELDKIRQIRNEVMHFDPDGIVESDLETLRKFAHFMRKLVGIGVI